MSRTTSPTKWKRTGFPLIMALFFAAAQPGCPSAPGDDLVGEDWPAQLDAPQDLPRDPGPLDLALDPVHEPSDTAVDLSEEAATDPDVSIDTPEDVDLDGMDVAQDPGPDGEDLADEPDIPIDIASDTVLEEMDAAGFSCGDPLVDERDDMVYATVLIGTQCWMAQNLDVGVMISGALSPTDNDIVEKYCYGDDPANCESYGALYEWNELMGYLPSDAANPSTTRGICPAGWHVPSDEEFKVVEMALGMTQAEADLANTWRGVGVGTAMLQGGSSGYEALLTGRRKPYSPYFDLLGSQEYTYTSTEWGDTNAWRRCFSGAMSTVGRWNTFSKSYGFPVRCLQD
ncbi:MAG: hypothetical protein JW797_20450 [Bradymonadales bacterium]|nr:hypothetical protein [Bradymonadales bacterium]